MRQRPLLHAIREKASWPNELEPNRRPPAVDIARADTIWPAFMTLSNAPKTNEISIR
jgi:hypothetical protein